MEPTKKHGIRLAHCPLLGVDITPYTKEGFISEILKVREPAQPYIIVGQNLHSVYLWHTSESLNSLYRRADVILADGKPVEIDARLGARLARRSGFRCQRIGSTDWLFDALSCGHFQRVAVIGASRESNAAFIDQLEKACPELSLMGFSGENWDSQRAELAIGELSRFSPDFTVIGLGMPLQEEFLLTAMPNLPDGVYSVVGGAIDQLAGEQKNAPRWMGKYGIEWLYRLATQPSRLSYRYLVEPWRLMALRVGQLARHLNSASRSHKKGENTEQV